MKKSNLIKLISICIIFSCCRSVSKSNLVVGKWKSYKIEYTNAIDSIDKGEMEFSTVWTFTNSQLEAVKGDPVDYILKDSLIFLKGNPYYKIEKLTTSDLILTEMQCGKDKWDLCTRYYFKRE